VLGDFDVSKSSDERRTTTVHDLRTMTLHPLTAAYAAPELASGKEASANASSDIYSAGLVMCELIEPGFVAKKQFDLAHLRANKSLVGLEALFGVLQQILSEDPRARPSALAASRSIVIAKNTPTRNKVPLHWDGFIDDGIVRRIDLTAEMKGVIESMMNKSSVWSNPQTPNDVNLGRIDSHHAVVLGSNNGIVHGGYEVVRVERIENHRLWRKYRAMQRELAAHMDHARANGYAIPEIVLECYSEWQHELGLGRDRITSANEVFGFHGCPAAAANKIAIEGFDNRVSTGSVKNGSSVWFGYFGSGIYIAENASKSDEYTKPEADGTQTMFVVRGCLGIPFQHHGNAGKNLLQTVMPGRRAPLWSLMRAPFIEQINRAADSLHHVAARQSGNKNQNFPWKNSEFIVYDRAQAYPELLITYKRVPL
jgi:serine/threonine protein kinase